MSQLLKLAELPAREYKEGNSQLEYQSQQNTNW